MGYNLPDVQIERTYISPSATLREADMHLTLIAPLYRIVDKVLAMDNFKFPIDGITPTNKVTLQYPKIDPGAVVDLSSVKLFLKDAILEISKQATGVLNNITINTNSFKDQNVNFVSEGIKNGDSFIVGEYGSSNGVYTIIDVKEHELIFAETIYKTFTGIDTGYRVTRKVNEWLLSSISYYVSQKNIEVTNAFNGQKKFLSGAFYVSYKTLRKDKVGLIKYENFDDVVTDMEIDSIENRLGFYIKNAVMTNDGNSTVFNVFFLDEDSDNAFINALSDLANYDGVYHLVPLTSSRIVRDAYAAHVTAMTKPEESKFRMFIQSGDLIFDKQLATGSASL